MSVPPIPGLDDADEPAERPGWRPVSPSGQVLAADDVRRIVPAALLGSAATLDGYDELARRALTSEGLSTSDQDDDEVQRFLRALAEFFHRRPALAEMAARELGLA